MPLPELHKGRVFDELEDAYRVLSAQFTAPEPAEGGQSPVPRGGRRTRGHRADQPRRGRQRGHDQRAGAPPVRPAACAQRKIACARSTPRLPALLERLDDGDRDLLRVQRGDDTLQLVLYATTFDAAGPATTSWCRSRTSATNWSRREIESWQKLIRVLTHEIMNSVTPIISLSKLIQETLSGDGRARPSAGADRRRAQRPAAQRQCGALAQQRPAGVRPGLSQLRHGAGAGDRGRGCAVAAGARAHTDGRCAGRAAREHGYRAR